MQNQEELKELLNAEAVSELEVVPEDTLQEIPKKQEIQIDHFNIHIIDRIFTKFKKDLCLRMMAEMGIKTELVSCLPLAQIVLALTKNLEKNSKKITVTVKDEDELLLALQQKVKYRMDIVGDGEIDPEVKMQREQEKEDEMRVEQEIRNTIRRGSTFINLLEVRITPEAAKLMNINAIALRECRIFNFTRCKINAEVCTHLSELFKVLGPVVQQIHLSHNQLQDEGVQQISNCLPSLTQLSMLNLGSNGLHRIGALLLSNCFANLKNLQYLYLQCNSLADDGALALSSNIGQLKSLRQFNISQNAIGAGGIKALLPKLGPISSLTELILDDNDFGIDGLLCITELIEKRKNMIFMCTGPFKGLLYIGLKNVGVASALAISDFTQLCTSKGLATNVS